MAWRPDKPRLKRRQPTQQRVGWPFLYSVDAQRGLVLNVAPPAPEQPAPSKVFKKKRPGGWHRRSYWKKRRREADFNY